VSNAGARYPQLAATIDEELRDRLRRVQLLCLDVDGVLTDGRLLYTSSGEELKAFHTQDGSALKRLQAQGVELAIISGRTSAMVQRRAAELGINYLYEGYEQKLPALDALVGKSGIPAGAMAHVGDDIADLELFASVGVAFSVADAHPEVRERADLVATLPGGQGAVRELVDTLISVQASDPA